MRNFVLYILLFCIPAFAYDFKVTIKWDEMAVMGEAEGILQYYANGKVEAIRGNLNIPSSDGNVTVNRTFSGGSQEFIINDSKNKLFNIWIINDLMDEDFATDDDYYMLSASKATIWVEDNVNNETYQIEVPQKTRGLAFRGGAIVDGTFYEITEMFEQQRIYKVAMVNAVNGQPLPGVSVTIMDKRTGETVAMGKTDEEGLFSKKIDYGKYDVKFSKPGFLASKHEFAMDITELPVSMNFALTPEVQEYRIVLTWGAYPQDLDAHLRGPKPEGGNFHIWWRNKILIGGKNFLDVDDQHSYGPETITIYKPAKGTYEYAVHNFSGRKRRGSQDLSYSGAHVDVYSDGRLQASYNVPNGMKGNVWKVFQINESQQLIPVNRLYDERNSDEVFR
ncbi:MAG: carboxypeptidase regulatory-like domain-containing protein [Calditrichaceae bacterium]|jgi:5-hydroxyisourate hydrolase-like protein (transthyretin family)